MPSKNCISRESVEETGESVSYGVSLCARVRPQGVSWGPWLLIGKNPFPFSSHHAPLGTSFHVLSGVLYGDRKKEKDGRERGRWRGREGRNEGFSTPRNMESFKVEPGAGCENSHVGCV